MHARRAAYKRDKVHGPACARSLARSGKRTHLPTHLSEHPAKLPQNARCKRVARKYLARVHRCMRGAQRSSSNPRSMRIAPMFKIRQS
eukprot:978950-Pleurochrysis_carterae.AAC.1